MRKFFLPLILLSLSVSTGAIAQPQRSGTPEEQKACTRDVQRYCRPVIDQGDFTILACLKQNRPKLTEACEQVLKEPQPIAARPHPAIASRRRVPGPIGRVADCARTSQIALVLASYSPIWGPRSLRMRGSGRAL